MAHRSRPGRLRIETLDGFDFKGLGLKGVMRIENGFLKIENLKT